MENVSSFGTQILLVASKTFPIGITLTKFGDDADPFDFPVVQISDAAMGVNGDLITWTTANIVPATINIIPDSDDDNLLNILFKANQAVRGRKPARDIITLTVSFPDGKIVTALNGVISSGMPSNSGTSSGKLKTKPYAFNFESIN